MESPGLEIYSAEEELVCWEGAEVCVYGERNK